MEDGFAIYHPMLKSEECSSLLSALADAPRSRAGSRHLLRHPAVAGLARDARLVGLARGFLGSTPFPFRATLFEKSPASNWLAVWHQDTALPFKSRFEGTGWGPWSVKEGVLYSHAPASALSHIVALRVHLDPSEGSNGPLRIVPGSHRLGVLTDEMIAAAVQKSRVVECILPAGGVLAMRPLVLHSSGKVTSQSPRRVIHLEYADSPALGEGLELAVV
jgi:hypothetical protein